jgi:hypothetical protein
MNEEDTYLFRGSFGEERGKLILKVQREISDLDPLNALPVTIIKNN